MRVAAGHHLGPAVLPAAAVAAVAAIAGPAVVTAGPIAARLDGLVTAAGAAECPVATGGPGQPKALDQERRMERKAKSRKRASDPDYDGLTAFASPDKTGVKPARSKDEESATSTPDSKKDFQKAKQN